jgi:hypothetical protein
MNAPSIDIKDLIESNSSLGLTFANNLFVGKEPSLPYNCVTVFDTPGFPPERLLTGSENGKAFEYPSIQIRVRNTGYVAAWTFIENIKNLLHGRAQETWNGTLYSSIFATTGPGLLDWDDIGNVRLFVNFDITRRSI